MDRFITTVPNKNNQRAPPRFYGNAAAVERIQSAIDANRTVCVHGESGTGKTFLVLDILLKNKNVVEITGSHIRSKLHAVELCEKLSMSYAHVVVDDVDTETYGFRELVDRQGKLSRGCMIILARAPILSLKCECVELKLLSVNELVNFAKDRFPCKGIADVIRLAKLSRGNIRDLISSFETEDRKDVFKTPQMFMRDLVCKKHVRSENPSDYIGKRIDEHGYSWGIIHENYVDSEEVLCNFSDIADWMSMADVLDSAVYDGNWEMLEMFSLYGIVMPAIHLNHSLDTDTMRPGSAWTKYSNFKMRSSKYRSIYGRSARVKLDLDTLQLLHAYCMKDPAAALPILKNYRITPDDINVINHLSLITKLKPRALCTIKKLMQQQCAQQKPKSENEPTPSPSPKPNPKPKPSR